MITSAFQPGTGQAACDVTSSLQHMIGGRNHAASDEVNDQILSLINETRRNKKLTLVRAISESSSREYADHFFKWMRSLETRAIDTRAEVEMTVQNTKITDLKRLEQVARERQITRYQRLKREMIRLTTLGTDEARARAEILEKVLSKDGIALGNGPHVQEVISNVEINRSSILKLLDKIHSFSKAETEHYFQYLKTLAAVHDLGKTFPDKWVETAANLIAKEGGNPIFTNRVGFHEFSSAVRLKSLEHEYQLDQKTVNSLIRNILGHNDGSGLPDVFWNQVAFPEAMLNKYPVPETLASKILALADRGGQATLGETGGVFKITNQQEHVFKKVFGRELLEETMNKSATNTIRQIEAIAKSIGHGMDQSQMVKDLIQAQQNSLNAFRSIEWNAESKTGKIAGHPFESSREFFDFVNGQGVKFWARPQLLHSP